MASFEPVVVLFGSNKSISTISLRLPVLFVFATDEESLEELTTINPQLSDTCLQRYFVVLLESVSDDVLEGLKINHRVQIIYSREALPCLSNHEKLSRIINKQLQQFTLDLTSDIVQFLTTEGVKQAKLERLHMTRIYYRQARLLKEWAMTFIKAEPCHILIIPLNTNRDNLDSAVERLQKLCIKLGYPSIVIRTLANYIPSLDEVKPYLLPYSQALFNHEHPPYICELMKKLSPLRLYLYGNEEDIPSEWSHLMINRESQVMEDEDSWCAFIENEYIDNEMKWNIGPMFGEKWRIKRFAPLNLSELDENLRFQSALRRAFKTFSRRQFEVTAEIFDWYDKCLREGHLQLEPKLSIQQENKAEGKQILAYSALSKCRISNPSSFNYHQVSNSKGMSFIWLDEILNSSDDNLNQIITPFQWSFFNDISQCLSFIEHQIREENQIFLVTSGSLGYELFLTTHHLMSTIRFVYIYCSRLGFHEFWIKYYTQIKGVFNDTLTLGVKIQQNLQEISQAENKDQQLSLDVITKQQIPHDDQTLVSVPVTIYNPDQAQAFIAHQRTIDTLLCAPFTDESRAEMIAEFRRAYNDNDSALIDIDIFEKSYHANTALQWYTRDSFLFRLINKALRSSDVEMMFKLRYFLTDLYVQLDGLYQQSQTLYYRPTTEKFYRGQIMFKEEFERFKQCQGDIISINTFLSMTTSLQVALTFANASSKDNDVIPIVFCIETNSQIEHKRPYANISNFSINIDEEEVLFAMGSLFRIHNIQQLDKINNISIIYLQMIDQNQIDCSGARGGPLFTMSISKEHVFSAAVIKPVRFCKLVTKN